MHANSSFAFDNSEQVAPEVSKIKPDKRLKICILGYRSAPYGGGQGIYIKYLSKALVELGHEVDVISGQPYPHVDERVRLIKMPSMNLYETGLGSIRPHHLTSLTNIIEWCSKLTGGFAEPYCFGRRVLKYLRKHGRDYDIIHDNQTLATGILQLQNEGFPVVTTIHHPITNDLSIELAAAEKWYERVLIKRWHSFLTMQRKVAPQLDHVITVSQRSLEDISTSFKIPKEKIQLFYNGIDTAVFRPKSDIKKEPYRIMATASADSPLKGVKYLLEGIALLKDKYPQLKLLMVGRPKLGGETEASIDALGLKPYIEFVSGISTEELVDYYNQAKVVVVPSIYEGFGLPAGEAMACGAPLVSTDGGALPEVVGEVGTVVPIRDSQAIADAVAQLLDDEVKQAAFARLGRQRIVNLFSWELKARALTEYYHQAVVSDKKVGSKKRYANR